MPRRIQQRIVVIAAILICLLPFSVAATPVQNLYVFGDSLSDTGNVFQASLLATGKGLPPPPYFDGRFCNGALWIDDLATQLQLSLTPITRLSKRDAASNAINLAYGGATSGSDNTVSDYLPGLQQEVAQFKSLFSSQVPTGLYVIWVGANDYLSQVSRSPDVQTQAHLEPVKHITEAIRSLYELGARQFLVANLPALGKTPLAARFGETAAETLNQLTQQHNRLLRQQLAELKQSLPQIKIMQLEVDRLFDQAISKQLAITEVKRPCLDLTTGEICSNPDQHLFWDAIHPTTAAHRYINQLALDIIQAQIQAQSPQPFDLRSFDFRSFNFLRWLLLSSVSLLFIGVIWFRRIS